MAKVIPSYQQAVLNGSEESFTSVWYLFIQDLNATPSIANYEEGSFTPIIAFGGNSVGVTYTTQTGTYTKIGNKIFINITITLSSKGSSVGNVTIEGLPSTVKQDSGFQLGSYANFSGLTGIPFGVAGSTTTTITLSQTGAAASAILTNANITNTSTLILTGFYKI